MSEANPYAPPKVAEISSDDGDYAWYITGIGVMVKNGTVLPAIELETGNEGPALVLVDRKFVKPHWSASLGTFIYPAVILAPHGWMDWPSVPFWLPAVIVIIVLSVVMTVISKIAARPIRFQLYRDSEIERRAKRRELIRKLLFGMSSLTFLGAVVIYITVESAEWWALLGFIIVGLVQFLGTVIWNHLDRPQIHMAPADVGWVRLAGVHQTALRKLRAIKANEASTNRPDISARPVW